VKYTIVSALNRLVREGRLTKGPYFKAEDDLILDLVDVAICDLDAQVTSKAIECLEQSVLRGIGPIHIACALTLLADCFLTANKRQHDAALFAGLSSVLVEYA
jgi:predicted nucleic acid-binding protein